jgi:RNA polymerase sigma-70 factor, ECF subfamily
MRSEGRTSARERRAPRNARSAGAGAGASEGEVDVAGGDFREPFRGSAGDAAGAMEAAVHAGPRPLAAADLAPRAAMLRRYLFVLGAPPDRLDDVVQEVFVLALGKPFEHRGEQALGVLLRAIAKNLLLRERRSAAARREVELAHEVWCEDGGDGDGDERLDALRACVDALPPRSRALLDGAYREQHGRDELARRFALRPDGVKTALRRLRDGLRACIERRRGGR